MHMGLKEEQMQCSGVGVNNENSRASIIDLVSVTLRASNGSPDKDTCLLVCRVCYCTESDRRGDAALSSLDILPPSQGVLEIDGVGDLTSKVPDKVEKDGIPTMICSKEPGFIELREGEVVLCTSATNIESGSNHQVDTLIHLGCSCKNDLSLVHYACALKWFISRGSCTCEICGTVAKNIRVADIKKVMASLKDYESLRERTATGEPTNAHVETNSSIDPDAVPAIRRQRLCEVSSWFNPHNSSITVSQEAIDQLSNNHSGTVVVVENPASKWAVEATAILVATGLLTVTLAWLLTPHDGKRTAENRLHILLGGVCSLTIVIFLRFVVLSKIKYGPARYWAILFVFWFLVFGIWASRAHGVGTRSN